ncbi:ribose-5-phosphate isomerase RpiA [Aquibacillus rhizosphaerae]|uniref:Ribose-5-phosphate isomerase A n=1 Tax=Aquibacillus rhizosphaerae TaxID=3051431 RepID=A0ABT7L1S5_9BACI|nr:ribose-5-phosphate isomerase RpiA [Aquibacillus sp. LR5S19]MDL4839774.1 ribose-5-phosphate isomerase RpiA [Aquibacillus sp. LR5S19]
MNTKKLVGENAVDYISDGMIVGLGTGSTAYWMVVKLGELVKKGLDIKGVATSKSTETLAHELDIPLVNLSTIEKIDVTIDGADEVNPELQLIKGGGGALLREKMVASISDRLIIVVDESKYVSNLGHFPLPVEVVPFGWELTRKQIEKLGCIANLRIVDQDSFITDNGNYILDCYFEAIHNTTDLHMQLNKIIGVVENGLFVNMANTVLIGLNDGRVKTLTKESTSTT